jgi:hypothetical protein
MSTTYNVWIIEIKNIAVRSRVWKYVDSKKSESESLMFKYSRFLDFVKIVSIFIDISTSTQDKYRLSATTVVDVSFSLILILESCSNYKNFFESQKRSYDVKKRAYRHIQNEVDRVMIDIEKIHTIILKFAKDYVVMNMRIYLVKKILQFLTWKFKKILENIQR